MAVTNSSETVPAPWKVKQHTGQHGNEQWRTNPNGGRTLFEGLEEDAREWVENNFPRPHLEPQGGGDELKADVHLVSPDGTREHFLGKAWYYVDDDETEE